MCFPLSVRGAPTGALGQRTALPGGKRVRSPPRLRPLSDGADDRDGDEDSEDDSDDEDFEQVMSLAYPYKPFFHANFDHMQSGVCLADAGVGKAVALASLARMLGVNRRSLTFTAVVDSGTADGMPIDFFDHFFDDELLSDRERAEWVASRRTSRTVV